MLKERPLPSTLYKYTSVENALLTIRNKTLWFASPRQFNDPFDCNTSLLDFTPSSAVIKEFINDKVAGNRAVRRREIAKNRKSPHRIVNQTTEQAQALFYDSGVCCLSALNQHILMWAHYASNHSGVCLGFDSAIAETATLATWVEYLTNFSKVNFWTGKERAIAHVLLSKADDWHYEQEIRLIRIASCGTCPFAAIHLKEVVFGMRTSPHDIEEIKQAVEEAGYPGVVFRQAVASKTSFSLIIK